MRWKWIVTIGILMIAILITAVYVYLNTYDYNKLKPLIARLVEDATGRKLSLGGEVNLEIGLMPALVITDVALANVSWGSQPQMIKIERLQAKIRLLPLLLKDLAVNQIGLFGVKVLLETGSDAQGNWDFLAGSNASGSSGSLKPSKIDVDQVTIENLHFTFRRHKTGSPTQFTLANLAMTRRGTEDALMLKLKADYNGQPVTLAGKTGLIRRIFAHQRFPLQLSGKSANAKITIQGAIDDVLNLKGVDLKSQLSGNNLATLGPVLDIQLPKTKAFDVTGQLKGSKDSLRLDNINGNLSGSGVDIAISGSVGSLIALSGVDLKLKSSGKDLAVMEPVIGEKIPATDEFEIQGRFTGSAEALTLQEAQGNARRGSISIAVNGTIKDLLTLKGMDLQSRLTGKDLAELSKIIGEKLPATDQFDIRGRLTGSGKTLSLSEASGRASRGRMILSMKGKIKDLLNFSGVDLVVKGSGKDLTAIGAIIDAKLPATEEFAVKGRLTGSTKVLSLLDARGSARRGSLRIAVNGAVKDLFTLKGMDLQCRLTGKDLAKFGEIIGEKLPASDKFVVQGRLIGSTKALSLLKAEGNASRGSLNLTFKGAIKELLALKGITIKLDATGKELAEIGPLVGTKLPELGPFEVNAKLSGSAKDLLLNEFSAIIDKSDFNGLAKVAFLKRPKITLRLESSVIDFNALMKSIEMDEKKTANKNQQQRRLFLDDPLPFDFLKKVDADIVLKAKNIHAKDARLNFGHMTLKLEEGEFDIDKLEATYKETKISGNLHIINGSPSRVTTNFLFQNLDLGGFLRETGVNDRVQGKVDIAAHLNSSGDSVQSLMADLDGSIGAVMGEGYLTDYLDLLSIDLSKKVIHFWGRHEKGDQIQCAVVQFDIKDGVAASRAFVFNTQIGLLTGGGKIHLGTEKIDFLLVPKPKHPGLLELSTKLRVSGSILDSKVRPDTLAVLEKGAWALSALAIGPLGLLAPFVHLGAYEKHPCEIQSIDNLGLQSPASE